MIAFYEYFRYITIYDSWMFAWNDFTHHFCSQISIAKIVFSRKNTNQVQVELAKRDTNLFCDRTIKQSFGLLGMVVKIIIGRLLVDFVNNYLKYLKIYRPLLYVIYRHCKNSDHFLKFSKKTTYRICEFLRFFVRSFWILFQNLWFCKNYNLKQILLYLIGFNFFNVWRFWSLAIFITISKNRNNWNSWVLGIFWFGLHENNFKTILWFCKN